MEVQQMVVGRPLQRIARTVASAPGIREIASCNTDREDSEAASAVPRPRRKRQAPDERYWPHELTWRPGRGLFRSRSPDRRRSAPGRRGSCRRPARDRRRPCLQRGEHDRRRKCRSGSHAAVRCRSSMPSRAQGRRNSPGTASLFSFTLQILRIIPPQDELAGRAGYV